MTKRILLALLATLFVANVSAEPVDDFPTNKDGSPVTGVLTAAFDPLDQAGKGPVYPFPFNLFFLDLEALAPTQDLTLVVPVEDPNDFTNPLAALGAMDGFSTTEKWTTSFIDGYYNSSTSARPPGDIDSDSVIPGHSVRVFQVSTANPVFVTGIVRELTPFVDYVATTAPGGILAIVPLKPLQEMTTYMAVLTNDITDTRGNNATPDSTYYLLKRTTPWVDENGNSSYPLIPDELARTLEAVRPLVNSWENAAVSAGIPREDIILSWPVQTQSVTPVLKQVRSIAKPAPTVVGPANLNTAAVGGMGLADIYAGIITLPYYLGVPSAENPTAPLFDFWTAAPGAYVPPFDAALPDKTSTHITVANPFPVLTDHQTVPLLMTVPNEASGHSKPAAGWPVVIFHHGLRRQRTDMLFIADTAAAAGYAVIAIDAVLHGIRPEDTTLAPFYIENTPFADVANERTFNVDYVDNATGALVPDGITDESGLWAINFISLLTQRDNLRQTQADFSVLAVTVPTISIDGDALPDLDGSTIQWVSISGGSVIGPAVVATEPLITGAFMSVGGGGIARLLNGSEYYGPQIQAALKALAGIEPGMREYEQYLMLWQTMIESADAINWAAEAARFKDIVVHEVINDDTVPNFVPGAPLSGTEPMIQVMGLTPYSSTQVNPAGLDLVGRFVPPAVHSSFLDPTASPAATMEMQKQLASFLASRGTTVVVEDAATMVPASEPGSEASAEPEQE